MSTCFVIQPFDRDKFDRRYKDIFEPAIKNADLDPYRVDQDPSVKIPIEDIEKGIEKSKICFAEISTDNPNVWYELGYAFACKKDVILVCESDIRTKFPFDIQHRHIITYTSTSKSDFEKLQNDITTRIKAITAKSKKMDSIIENPVKETEGLKPHEVTLMVLMTNQLIKIADPVSLYSIEVDMDKAGYTKAAANLAVINLKKEGLIKVIDHVDYNGNEYMGCQLTEKGENWILSNQDKIQILKDDEEDISDEIPF